MMETIQNIAIIILLLGMTIFAIAAAAWMFGEVKEQRNKKGGEK